MSEPPKAEPGTAAVDIDEPVPKLPRGRGMKFSGPEMFRIVLMLVTLIGVIVLTRPCSRAVSGFVTSFDNDTGSSAKAMPKPGNVDMPGSAAPGSAAEPQYEQLKPGMSEAEIKAAMERSKARNAAAQSAGSAAAPPADNAAGSATGSSTPKP